MDDTVSNKDIGGHDLGAVDGDGAVVDRDVQLTTADRSDGRVRQRAAVRHGSIDDCQSSVVSGVWFHQETLPWRVRIFASWSVVRLATADPMAVKAALFGAKRVMSFNNSTVLTRLAVVKALVRPPTVAVVETF